MLKGKKLSILGDSISTYRGISNDVTANHTIAKNPCFYDRHMRLDDTYWSIVMKHFDLTLCVNNSWSGGNMSGREDPCSGVNRAGYLSRDDGTSPDIIIVFMGINDLGRGFRVSEFSADYAQSLMIIKEKNPDALVCCVNIPDRNLAIRGQAVLFNAAIDAAVATAGDNFFVADLFHSRLSNRCYYENSIDTLHPDDEGMKMIADVVIDAINQKCM